MEKKIKKLKKLNKRPLFLWPHRGGRNHLQRVKLGGVLAIL
jgi:hypothetical protein